MSTTVTRAELTAHLRVHGWYPVEDGISNGDSVVWKDPMGNVFVTNIDGAKVMIADPWPETTLWPDQDTLVLCAQHEGLMP